MTAAQVIKSLLGGCISATEVVVAEPHVPGAIYDDDVEGADAAAVKVVGTHRRSLPRRAR